MNPTETSTQADDLALLAASARALCDKDAALSRLRTVRGMAGGFDRALWSQMVELGWTAIRVPESADGLGLGVGALATVCGELGRVAAPEPLLEIAGVSACLLAQLPRQVEVTQLLIGIGNGTCLPVVAWQEHPMEPASDELHTRAEKIAGGYRLQGRKYCVPFADTADGMLVNALFGDSHALFWVPRGTLGVEIVALPLADGTAHATVKLQGVELSDAALLGQGGAAAAALASALDEGALLTAAYLCGLMTACFDITLKYLHARQQFGRAIGSFQALQHRMVNMALQRDLAQATLDEVVQRYAASGVDPLEQALLVSRAKYRANEAGLMLVREAIQLHGAIGFTDECNIGLFVNRALVCAASFGNATWHCRRIAELAAGRTIQRAELLATQVAEPADADWNTLSDEEFRKLVGAWFETEFPSALRYSPRRLHWHEVKSWYLQLSARGWLAPAWPREFGGMGLTPSKLLIFIEEQERWGVARTPDMGIVMVGPLLIKHGSPAQRAYYLPKILAGEHIWCQGYSEPNAGSDLASLRTEAVLEGDHFVVNGQKTWTTLAQDATHMFLLARTAKDAKKQAGISFLLVDMQTPGITVRPIRNLAGHEEFCEVFLDNVKVPRENVVGALNQGWTIAKALLSFERIFLGSPKQSQYALQRLTEVARHCGLFTDPAFRDRYTRLKCDVLDLETFYGRFAAQVKRGEALGAEVSLLKIFATETFARLSELLIESVGSAGAALGKLALRDESEVDVLSLFYAARPATIYGGSNEIQRNIVAKAVLGLPD
jgi:3-oxochol-4-en-24-oyl-CoA dehydrogenase